MDGGCLPEKSSWGALDDCGHGMVASYYWAPPASGRIIRTNQTAFTFQSGDLPHVASRELQSHALTQVIRFWE